MKSLLSFRSTFLTTLSAFMLSTPLYAADLVSVYEQALNNDAQLSAAVAKKKADEEVVDQSLAGLLPNIAVTGSTSTIDQVSTGGIGNALNSSANDQRFNTNQYEVRLTQPLLRVDRWFQFRSARQQGKIAVNELANAEQDLVLRVAEAYFNILRAEDNLSTSIAAENAFKRQLEQSQERFDVGLIAITEVHEAQAAYDLARVDRITQESARDNSYTALETLTNKRYVRIMPLDKEMPIQAPDAFSKDQWIEAALASNIDLEIARQQVASNKELVRQRKSAHLPTLDGVASYGETDQGGIFGSETDTETLSLQLTIPIFEGGGTQSRVREAYQRYMQSKSLYEFEYRSVKQNVQTQHRTVISDAQRVGARKLALISNQSALDATRGGYDVGTRNIVDLIQAERDLYQALSDYSNSIYDFIINSLRLKQVTGTLKAEDLTELNRWLIDEAPGVKVEPEKS